jgi:uncharacterized protein YkwD
MKRKIPQILGSITLVWTSFLIAWFSFPDTPAQPAQPSQSIASTEVREPITVDTLYRKTNEVRLEHNIPEMKYSPSLEKSAQLKCDDMVKGNYYGHEHPDTGKLGASYVLDVGLNPQWMSENLNKGNFLDSDQVVDSWMNSKSHREAILNADYDEVGFATCTIPKWPDFITVVQHKIDL